MKFDQQEWKREGEEILEKLRAQFKTLKTWDDLQEFFITMKTTRRSFGIQGKRRTCSVFGWQQVSDTRVYYLYDDEVSTGKADICNLYRYLTIK